jgi:hypothetical protein
MVRVVRPVTIDKRVRAQRWGVGHALEDLGRDDAFIGDDVSVLAVEGDL